MKLAVDVMGGDHAPAAILGGCKQLLEAPQFQDAELVLFGDEQALRTFAAENPKFASRIRLVPTTEVIGFDESPTAAYKKKKDSSLVRAFEAVKAGEADCVVSAGSTGAILTGATLTLRRQKGVKRPAIATQMPTVTGGSVLLLDSGANTDCKPGYLQQFALMGKAYMERVAHVENPRIGLLSNGAEAEKGNMLTKEAHERLAAMDNIRFVGNVEGRDMMNGDIDVLVCDGFDGNVLLKGFEGAAKVILGFLKDAMYSSLRCKLGGLLAKPAFSIVKKKLDYKEYGGSPLLGVNGGVIKAHGSSDEKAIYNALRQGYTWVASDLIPLIGEAIASTVIED
ncbi:MAG: phosphate acyltransferase PlsX [Clostridia bacterium]|nr:phosphate acyltransferase PlsX [Clostridia bacterium]